ncbi:MAG: sigma-70 family RNA polymerase sigma factor, partial [Saprospiraceae bacterium]|nr:sigma-70 family RNA polymerase sigma factor [Saprospiraceae bacterium]
MTVCIAPQEETATSITSKKIEAFYLSTFPTFVKFVQSNGGNLADAEDVFQDAMVAFFEKNIQELENPEAYLMSIGKYLWFRKFKKESKVQLLESIPELEATLVDFYPTRNEFRLLKVLEKAGQRCMDILQAFFYKEWKIEEITSRLGFKNKHHASVQKYKCMEKV